MALPQYPASPSIGDTFLVGIVTFRWDGEKWKSVAPANHELRITNLEEVDTVALMAARPSPQVGEKIKTAEFSTGNGGGGTYDCVTVGTTANVDLPNTYNIIVSTTDIAKCFVLRVGEKEELLSKFGAVMDGATDCHGALAAVEALSITPIISGPCSVQSALSLTNVKFLNGGSIKPASAITVTITSNIQSGDYVIFDGADSGIFNLTDVSTTGRITWFSGDYVNDKWTNAESWFCGTGQANSYSFIFPRPDPNYSATAVVTKNGRQYWQLDGEMTWGNNASEGTILLLGAFFGNTSVGTNNIVTIGGASKLNNLNVIGDLVVHSDIAGTATSCVEINAVARLTIPGVINTQYGDYGTTIGGPNLADNSGAITIGQLHTFGYKYQGHRMSGAGAFSLTNINIGIIVASSPSATLTNVDFGLYIGGAVSNYNIDLYRCTTAGAGSSDPIGCLLIEGDSGITADGGGNKAGNISTIQASSLDGYLLNIDGDSASANVEDLRIGVLLSTSAGGSPNANSRDVNIDWAKRVTVENIGDLANTITVGANSGRVDINGLDGNGVTITDSGSKTFVNGVSFTGEAGGAGTEPSTSQWQIGDIVKNTDDTPDTVWLKIQHTGTSANDFVQLG